MTDIQQAGGGGVSRSGSGQRLQRSGSLDQQEAGSGAKPGSGGGASKMSEVFGVKSYLHHFYAPCPYKDPSVYDDDDDIRYLLHNDIKQRHCTSVWWKAFVILGFAFLALGIVSIAIGYFVPQRPIIVGEAGSNMEVIDRRAVTFNYVLDVCKLLGLIMFCVGGIVITIGLLLPSCLGNRCDAADDLGTTNSIRISLATDDEKPPLSPTDKRVPAYSTITEVQPERSRFESIYH